MAKEFRTSAATVYQLTAKAKKKPAFMDELFSKRDAEQQKHQLVSLVVQEMAENNEFIDSCKTVTARVNQQKEANMQSQQEQADEDEGIAQG